MLQAEPLEPKRTLSFLVNRQATNLKGRFRIIENKELSVFKEELVNYPIVVILFGLELQSVCLLLKIC